jgi:nicotinate-nucleotide pyrophosphorylase (carboxylating)
VAGPSPRRRARPERRFPTPLPRRRLARSLREFLREDRAHQDVTTRTVIPPRTRAEAILESQASGVVSGLEAAQVLAEELGLETIRHVQDGSTVRRGTRLLTLRGDARRILSAERTLVNLVMHLSGVATETSRLVRAVETVSPGLTVAATRKTLPGLRDLEKRAVFHGGGDPHRRDLASAILIKTNHLTLVPLRQAVRRAVQRARQRGSRRLEVMVEVRSLEEAREAIGAGADRLLLDNFSPAEARRTIQALEEEGLRDRVTLEVSGGISLRTIRQYARTGADIASAGSITHSARALPVHLVVRPWGSRRRSPPPPPRSTPEAGTSAL